MNAWLLLSAAGLSALLALAHSCLGERYILVRLFRRPDLPKLFGGTEFTRRTLRFAWHLTSVAWLGFAALLVQAASYAGEDRARVGTVLGVTFGISGVLTGVGSRGRHLAWPVFLTIAALTWWATR
jgi:hypothetical protein